MSKKAKAVAVVSIALLTVLIGALTLNAQVKNSSDTEVYDDFNSQWLDPNKWVTAANCWNGLPLECVREIQNGRLRLAIRAMGAQNSDFGDQQTASFLIFVNPSSIHAITATVTVRAAAGGSCSSNPFIGTGKAELDGVFFNTGSGSYLDDVHAALVMSNYNSDQLDVGGWIGDGNGVSSWTHLGNYPKGTPLTVTLAWDQPNHQFVFTVKPREGTANQVSVPYYVADSQPPTSANRQLQAVADPPNCTTGPAFSNIEALFDNVIVK